MNHQSQRRTNRGDETNAKIAPPSKSKEKVAKEVGNIDENFKRNRSKNHSKNDKAQILPSQISSKKRGEEQVRKSKGLDKSVEDLNKISSLFNDGDGYVLKEIGKIQKYVFHNDATVALKVLNYTLNLNEALLTLYDPKNITNKRLYYILSAKQAFFHQVKENEAFQLRVKKPNKEVVSDLILKAKTALEKSKWLEEFGLKIEEVSKMLKVCIEEVENRRFYKGQKKRNEVKELKDVDVSTLIRVLDAHRSHKLNFSNEKRWNISRMEKLIQTSLSEIPQPLIPFQLQEILQRSNGHKGFHSDYKKIVKRLPSINYAMLMTILDHLSNLTNYYKNQLDASKAETEKIRRNICSRLTPLIIRQELAPDTESMSSIMENVDNTLVDRFCDMFYMLMDSADAKTSVK